MVPRIWPARRRAPRLFMVELIITVTTRPGRVAEYVAAFGALALRVRLEEGCVEYDIYVDSDDARFDNEVRPDTVVLCEKWDSIEALQQHTRSSAALVEFRQAVKNIKLESHYWLLRPASNANAARCRRRGLRNANAWY